MTKRTPPNKHGLVKYAVTIIVTIVAVTALFFFKAELEAKSSRLVPSEKEHKAEQRKLDAAISRLSPEERLYAEHSWAQPVKDAFRMTFDAMGRVGFGAINFVSDTHDPYGQTAVYVLDRMVYLGQDVVMFTDYGIRYDPMGPRAGESVLGWRARRREQALAMDTKNLVRQKEEQRTQEAELTERAEREHLYAKHSWAQPVQDVFRTASDAIGKFGFFGLDFIGDGQGGPSMGVMVAQELRAVKKDDQFIDQQMKEELQAEVDPTTGLERLPGILPPPKEPPPVRRPKLSPTATPLEPPPIGGRSVVPTPAPSPTATARPKITSRVAELNRQD